MKNKDISKYRSEVIEGAIKTEWLMSIVICQHYFQKVNGKFLLEVMYDEYCSFALKRRIIEKIVEPGTINIQNLNRLGTIRNYYAHCNQEIYSSKALDEPFVPDPRNPSKPIDFRSLYDEYKKLSKDINISLMKIYVAKGGVIRDRSEL